MKTGRIIKVAGPLVVAEGMDEANILDMVKVGEKGLIGEIIEMRGDKASIQVYEETTGIGPGDPVVTTGEPLSIELGMVKVGEKGLIGEIIEMRGDKASIQVYEETTGIGPGDPVVTTGEPLSIELGPGLIESMFDGIQRPLDAFEKVAQSPFLTKGVSVTSLNRERVWNFNPTVKIGDKVEAGDVIGTVQETAVVLHKIMVPYGIEGTIKEIKSGDFTVVDTVCVVETAKGDREVQLMQKWPARKGRPYAQKLKPEAPMTTGQRVIDTFFPVAKGGAAAVPGPFGAGKTVVQHQIAKWGDAEIVVYVGCGERGNEMTDVLNEFPELKDPKTGESLMKRTVLIANTSNMPVAAREACIYTGITIAEYFRDMGYSVSIMADSTSRWAEALREMSGRLEEMPGDEGYPAYLGSRLSDYYERAGKVVCLGKDGRQGAVTAIGAVSPPGGDLSEPVTQSTLRIVKVFWGLDAQLAYKRHFPAINWINSYSLYADTVDGYSEPVTQSTLRIVKVFWGLDAQLAYKRHFPAINWINSYSLYADTVDGYLNKTVAEDWSTLRQEAMALLQEESGLQEIVSLVGIDALSEKDRLKLEVAKSIREDYLQQNGFHEIDTYTSLDKQYKMLKLVLLFRKEAERALEAGVYLDKILELEVRDKIARSKYIHEDDIAKMDDSSLQEIVSLVGIDALSEKDRLKLEVSKSIREDYLQQNGFHEIDTYTSLDKQYKMLKLVLLFRKEAERALDAGVYLDKILGLEVRDKIARSKYIHEDEISKMDDIAAELRADIDTLINEGGVLNA